MAFVCPRLDRHEPTTQEEPALQTLAMLREGLGRATCLTFCTKERVPYLQGCLEPRT